MILRNTKIIFGEIISNVELFKILYMLAYKLNNTAVIGWWVYRYSSIFCLFLRFQTYDTLCFKFIWESGKYNGNQWLSIIILLSKTPSDHDMELI